MRLFVLSVLALAALTAPAAAADQVDPLLGFGVGYYDIVDGEADALDVRLEYRPGYEFWGGFRSFVGVEANNDGSIWGGGGLLYDWKVTDNIYVNPSFGAGLYTDGDSDKDLDYPIEFRSQIEAGVLLGGGSRIGVAFGHLSNASLGDDNPGTEVLNVYYHVPMNF
jgi:lipid A 3-O-deacylase